MLCGMNIWIWKGRVIKKADIKYHGYQLWTYCIVCGNVEYSDVQKAGDNKNNRYYEVTLYPFVTVIGLKSLLNSLWNNIWRWKRRVIKGAYKSSIPVISLEHLLSHLSLRNKYLVFVTLRNCSMFGAENLERLRRLLLRSHRYHLSLLSACSIIVELCTFLSEKLKK